MEPLARAQSAQTLERAPLAKPTRCTPCPIRAPDGIAFGTYQVACAAPAAVSVKTGSNKLLPHGRIHPLKKARP